MNTAVRKNSIKRQAILAVLMATKEHPSAERIYAELKPQYPDLSLGTVYRNLNLFREDGTIMVVGTVNGQERFDFNTEPHPHFICTGCGRVIDIDMPMPGDALWAGTAAEHGLGVRGCQITLTGLCRDCSEKEKTQAQTPEEI